MSITPLDGEHYPIPGVTDQVAVRVTTVARYADGGQVGGLIGWAVNLGAQGAVDTVDDWAMLPYEDRLAIAKKRGHQLRSTAASKGTKVHQLIDLMLHGTAQPWQVETHREHADAFEKFVADYGPVALEVETTRYGMDSVGRWWGGTPDLIATVNGKNTLLDWKTTSDLSKEVGRAYIAQLGGYIQTTHCANVDGDSLQWPARPIEAAMLVFLHPRGYRAVEVDLIHARALWDRCWELHITNEQITKELNK